jgi:excisionase family DNA binding protein
MADRKDYTAALGRAAEMLAPGDIDRIALEELRELLAAPAMTTGDAAGLLGIRSKNTVKRLLEEGRIEGAMQTRGGHWRIPSSGILAYREAQLAQRRSGSLRPARTSRRRLAPLGR